MAESQNANQLHIKKEWCKGCGICVEFCPRNVLKLSDNKVTVVDAESCIGCRMCEKLCPDFVITVSKQGNK